MSIHVEKATQVLSRNLMLPLRLEEIDSDGLTLEAIRLDGIRNSQSFRVVIQEEDRMTSASLEMDRYAGPIVRAMAERVKSGGTHWAELIDEARSNGVVTVFNLNGSFVDFEALFDVDEWVTLAIQCMVTYRQSRDDRVNQIMRLAGQLLSMCTDSLEIVFDSTDQDPDLESQNDSEGRNFQVRVTRFERSPINRFRCIQHFGAFCQVCGIDFEAVYGPLGAGFIEVHHRTPVSSLGEITSVDPIIDLIPLCSNCHSMVHRISPPMPPEKLREILGKA